MHRSLSGANVEMRDPLNQQGRKTTESFLSLLFFKMSTSVRDGSFRYVFLGMGITLNMLKSPREDLFKTIYGNNTCL